jgi:hypothetical protein
LAFSTGIKILWGNVARQTGLQNSLNTSNQNTTLTILQKKHTPFLWSKNMSLFNHWVELKYLLEKVTIGVHGAQSHPQSSWGNSTMAWSGESTSTQANKDALTQHMDLQHACAAC